VDSFTSLVKRGAAAKGVKVSREEGTYRLSLCLKVDYGVNIPSLACELMEKVKGYVEGLTDVQVAEVEIIIEDIEPPA
jgi:uncharacterized alkaline shock family protein YloU